MLKPIEALVFERCQQERQILLLALYSGSPVLFYWQAFSSQQPQKNIEKLCFSPKFTSMLLSDILSVEKRNPCSIGVYQLDNTKLVSVYHSKNQKGRYKFDLLRLLENNSSHYCLIKIFPNLLDFLTRSKSKQNKGPISRFCRNCFQPIVKKKNFKKHVSFCQNNAPLEIRMPLESTTLEFVSWEKTQKCPFVVYADLEAINVETKSLSPASSRTRETER